MIIDIPCLAFLGAALVAWSTMVCVHCRSGNYTPAVCVHALKGLALPRVNLYGEFALAGLCSTRAAAPVFLAHTVVTVGYLSFGPIEKYIMFLVTSACARRTRAASQAFERMHDTLSRRVKT